MNLIILYLILIYMIISIVNIRKIKEASNKNESFYYMLLSIIMFVASFFILIRFSSNLGLGILFYGLLLAIFFIIVLISIIMNFVKSKKYSDEIVKLNTKPLIIIFIPIIFFFSVLVYQIICFNRGEVIVVYNYQNGIIESDYYEYVISQNCIKPIIVNNIKKYSNHSFEEREIIDYKIEFKNNKGEYTIKSYEDKELKKIKKDVIEGIIFDSRSKHNEQNNITTIYIYHIDGSNYYIVILGINNSNDLIYYNDKFIGEIESHGDLDSTEVIKK